MDWFTVRRQQEDLLALSSRSLNILLFLLYFIWDFIGGYGKLSPCPQLPLIFMTSTLIIIHIYMYIYNLVS